MKKNRTMRIAVLMLALSLLTCCFVGSTFAKYTSSASGSSTATVAKWSINVEGTEIAVTGAPKTVAFDLFTTINDTKAPGGDETDVADNLIAPGTTGSFELNIANNSEVTAEYDILYTISNTSNVPLEFSLTGAEDSWTSDIATLNATNVRLEYADDAETDGVDERASSVTVYWRWVFTTDASGDTADTALGIAAQTAAPKVTVTASIVVDQVD